MVITSVIVTYNRKSYLEKLLELQEQLSIKPNNVIVVNNNSNDGTEELLNGWKLKHSQFNKYVINIEKNIGGSGGFYEGMKKALEIKSDWVYVSDDDAFPDNNIFEEFNRFFKEHKEDLNNIAAVCGKVISFGEIDLDHRRRITNSNWFIKEKNVNIEEYCSNFEIDLFSYVGTIINCDYLRKFGLTERDYFIYYDDTEHSLRLSKYGKIICVPNIQIMHDTKKDKNNDLTWKNYYGYRNRLLMIKKHYNRRYFVVEYTLDILRIIKRLLLGKLNDANIIYNGIIDAKNNFYGVNNLYMPVKKE